MLKIIKNINKYMKEKFRKIKNGHVRLFRLSVIFYIIINNKNFYIINFNKNYSATLKYL